MSPRIAFQGEPGAYSHQACREARPDHVAVPCPTFEDAIEAVRSGDCEQAMIAVENSTYGRVADVHHLLPQSGLHILDEAFVRVHVNLLGVPGARIGDVRRVRSMSICNCGLFRSRSLSRLVSPGLSRTAAITASRNARTAATTAASPARLAQRSLKSRRRVGSPTPAASNPPSTATTCPVM